MKDRCAATAHQLWSLAEACNEPWQLAALPEEHIKEFSTEQAESDGIDDPIDIRSL